MTQPKVTIAVAIYNNKDDELKNCIESLIHQSLQDIEILLISDYSSDANNTLIQQYEKKDERIRVIINGENRGLASVRNQGIAEARGKYLCFVDGDDWIDLNICQRAYDKAEENEAEMVLWSFQTSIEGKNEPTNYIGPKECIYQKPEQIALLRTQILDPTFDAKQQIPMAVTAWAKIFLTDFLRKNADIRFPEHLGTGGEDRVFNYRIIGRLHKAVFIEEYGYYYRQNAASFTKKFRKNEWERRTKEIRDVKQYVPFEQKEQALSFYRFCLNEFIAQCTVTQFHPEAGLSHWDKRKEIKAIRNTDEINGALLHLGRLKFKKSKWVYFQLYKMKLYDLVLLLSRYYASVLQRN